MIDDEPRIELDGVHRSVRSKLADEGMIPSADVPSWELDFCIKQMSDAQCLGDDATAIVYDIFACEWDCGIQGWFSMILGMEWGND
jgi:hypothetical protein